MNSVIDEYYMTNSTQIFPRIFECVNGELPLGIFYSNCCFNKTREKIERTKLERAGLFVFGSEFGFALPIFPQFCFVCYRFFSESNCVRFM